MKYLKYFKTIVERDHYEQDHVAERPTLLYAAENKSIDYSTPPIPKTIKIVCFDTRKNTFVKKEIKSLRKQANIIPIGIEVIPASHNVYGNGKGGVMSLTEMSIITPKQGSLEKETMTWGQNKDTQSPNHNKVVTVSNNNLSSGNFGYLAKNGIYAGTPYIPNPYNEDDTRNPQYYDKTVTTANAMSDFNGKTNTDTLITLRGLQNYDVWKPSTAVTDYAAASVCDMYSTAGTQAGNWYLPAMGEIGYIMYYWDLIEQALKTVNKLYPDTAVILDPANCYWSSTENAAKNARYLHTMYGAGYSEKTALYLVRAFTQI